MSEIRHPECGSLPEPTVEEVADGIFTYVQLDGSWGLNNAGILPDSRGVTLIDTAFTESRARRLSEGVERVARSPVRTIVNTHHHGDHTYGNFVFPEATIIGHERCRDAVIATGLDTTKFFPGVEWGELDVVAPFVTFEERLNVYVGDLRVELIEMGPAAHTTNDIVAWIPDHSVIFTGDLVFNGGTPFVVMGSVEGTLDALDRVRRLGPQTLVPGHGPVCGPEVIDTQIEYLRFVQDTARAASEAGTSPLDAAREVDLGQFAGWTDSERLVGNLYRAFSEIAGEPPGAALPFDRIVEDMVTFNNGQPLRCCA
jgi:cyclase